MTTTTVVPRADGQLRRHGVAGVRLAGHVLALSAIAAILAALVIAVLVPRVGGATPYTVLTGSMRPDLPPGTLVVVKPVPAAEVALGSVITYQLVSGEPTMVTHRVVQVSSDAEGQPIWRTQGDDNPVPDQDWVEPVQLRGELWYAVPHLGRVNQWLTGDQRQTAVVVVAVALFGYATAMLLGALGDRRRGRARGAHA